ncbi:hypothetical protein LINPERHAP2_LOCUS41748 [Linum perenne]
MSRNRLVRAHDEFHYAFRDVEVLCHCRMRDSRRISHTDANPRRKFFGCPRYVSKIESGCDFFVWYDVKVVATAEKQGLVRLVDFLQNRIVELEYENKNLRTRLGEQADVGSSEVNVSTKLEMLTKRVSQLEMSSGFGFRVKK